MYPKKEKDRKGEKQNKTKARVIHPATKITTDTYAHCCGSLYLDRKGKKCEKLLGKNIMRFITRTTSNAIFLEIRTLNEAMGVITVCTSINFNH